MLTTKKHSEPGVELKMLLVEKKNHYLANSWSLMCCKVSIGQPQSDNIQKTKSFKEINNEKTLL